MKTDMIIQKSYKIDILLKCLTYFFIVIGFIGLFDLGQWHSKLELSDALCLYLPLGYVGFLLCLEERKQILQRRIAHLQNILSAYEDINEIHD